MLGERFKETEPAARDTSGSALNDAVRGVIAQLDRAFTSVGETFRDPDAKQRLREAAGRLGGALQTTFDEAGESLRARREGSGGSNPKDSGGSAGA